MMSRPFWEKLFEATEYHGFQRYHQAVAASSSQESSHLMPPSGATPKPRYLDTEGKFKFMLSRVENVENAKLGTYQDKVAGLFQRLQRKIEE
jgi:hypothetical protein